MEMLMVEEEDRLLERVSRKWFGGMNFWNLKSRAGFNAVGSVVSTGGTDGETVEAGAGNGIHSEERIVSDIVTGTYGEKYRLDSMNITSADAKYFLLEGL